MIADTVLRRSRLRVMAKGVEHTRPRWRSWTLLVLAVELLVLIGVGRVALHQFRYIDGIYPGVSVAGIPLAGLTLDQATEAIHAGLTPFSGPAIGLRYGDRTWSLTPADLGVIVDSQETAAIAYRLGRQSLASGADASLGLAWSGLQADLLAQWELMRDGVTVAPVYRLDSNRLAVILKQLAVEVDVPPREAQLIVTDLAVSGTPGQTGRLLDVDATRSALIELIHAGKGGTVDLVVRERPPALPSVDVAVTQATALLDRSLTVTVAESAGGYQFAVDPRTLRQWLAFRPQPLI